MNFSLLESDIMLMYFHIILTTKSGVIPSLWELVYIIPAISCDAIFLSSTVTTATTSSPRATFASQ